MNLSAAIRRAIVATTLAGLAGCGGMTTEPANGLAAARDRWARSAPAAYTITIARSCECLAEMSGPVVVTVRSGAVVSRHYVHTGAAVSPAYAAAFPAVEGLFAMVDAGVRSGVRPLDARYDPRLGYPTRFVAGDLAADAPVTSVIEFRAE